MSTTVPEANETTRSLKYITDYIGPFNAAVLVAMTIIDLATPHLRGSSARIWLALGIALALIGLAFRLRQMARDRHASDHDRSLAALFFADRRHWLAVAAVALGLTGLATHLSAEASRGVIASAVPGVASLQDRLGQLLARTEAIQADTSAIRAAVAPADPRGRLRLLGYGLDTESKAKALEACDIEAVRIYLDLGEALPLSAAVMGQRGGSTLERPLLEQNPKLPEVIQLLAAQGQRFDELQPLTFTQAMTRQIPNFDLLRQRVKDPLQRPALQAATTQATPLVLALWFGHEAAARALVTAGVSSSAPGVAALLPVVIGGVPTGAFAVTPLATATEVAAQMKREEWLK